MEISGGRIGHLPSRCIGARQYTLAYRLDDGNFPASFTTMLGAALYGQELLALHDEMRWEAQQQRSPLRQAIRSVALCYTTSDDDSGLSWLRLFKYKRPGCLIRAAGLSHRKHENLLHLAACDEERFLPSRECWDDRSNADLLILGQDTGQCGQTSRGGE